MARLEQQSFRMLPSTAPTITGGDETLSPSLAESDKVDDTESILTVRGPATDAQNARTSDQRQTFGYSFDQDLNTSRPYTRAMQNHRAWSTTSSEIHTMGWSCLSGLSLAEVSHVSVINLLFCPQDLWNGHRFSETRIERDGFLLWKYEEYEDSLAAPTFRRRLEAMTPVRAGQRGKTLSTIKEDVAVPVAARTILLIGMFPLRVMEESCCDSRVINYSHLSGDSLSGKTTIFNHLQILYGNGITDLERLTAFEFIIRELVDIFINAWPLWSDPDDRDRQETSREVRNPATYYVAC